MQDISNNARSQCFGETSWEDGSSSENIKTTIKNANKVPLTLIFKYFNINIDDFNRKTICPFKSHNGGQEKSPSFTYYPLTNSFWCFGCKRGNSPVDFVSFLESIKKSEAAGKILKLFNSEYDQDFIFNKEDFISKNKILLEYSEFIRNQIHSNNLSLIDIESKTKIFDSLHEKYELSNEALESVIDKLKL